MLSNILTFIPLHFSLQLIDRNNDGVVTIEELVDWCSRDEQILKSLETLDTVLWGKDVRAEIILKSSRSATSILFYVTLLLSVPIKRSARQPIRRVYNSYIFH